MASQATDSNPHSTSPEYKTYRHQKPFDLVYSAEPLPEINIAYETWGTLNPLKDNVILLHTGLSASSHAASNELNAADGWWEKFIGLGRTLDTNRFFIVCTNVLGGCYGSTGPSSMDPRTGQRYATNFPIISIFDMVKAQFALLDHLGINGLYASIGGSMGGMQCLAAGWLYPDRVGKVVSISGTARTSPGCIARHYAQRSVLMADPNWNHGFYYEGLPPRVGVKMARQIATMVYRSESEWDQRFGRKTSPQSEEQGVPGKPRTPALCPEFLVETYIDHQSEKFSLKYDANSFLYVSKAVDLFDMTEPALQELGLRPNPPPSTFLSDETSQTSRTMRSVNNVKPHPPPINPSPHLPALAAGLRPLAHIPALVLGVQSDLFFTVEQHREIADALRMAGNSEVRYYEVRAVWGHDTFLLDVEGVGGAIRGFLS